MSIDNSLLEPMVFDDIAPIEVPVKYGGREYVLVECDVPGVAKFKSEASAGMQVSDDGSVTRTRGVGDLDALLVELCLKEVGSDGKRRPVSRAFVNTMRPNAVKDLATRARDINPALNETPTKDRLDKQIERLVAMRHKLFGENDKPEDDAKN